MKGSILWVEIVCERCACTGYGMFVRGSRIPVREFQREAKKAGWGQLTNGDFRCGKCTKALTEEANHFATCKVPDCARCHKFTELL